MGKTTAAQMLQHLKVPVHDSDAAVHELMQPEGKAMRAIYAAFPLFEYPEIYERHKKTKGKVINRSKLGALVFEKEQEREKLEAILHPLVRESQTAFIRKQRALGSKSVALDIPLLFETGAELLCDYTIVVTAPAHIQYSRVLSRPGMDEEKLEGILKRQMPDGEKRARADFVVQTGLSRAVTMKQLKSILHRIRESNRQTLEHDAKEEDSDNIRPFDDRGARSPDRGFGSARV